MRKSSIPWGTGSDVIVLFLVKNWVQITEKHPRFAAKCINSLSVNTGRTSDVEAFFFLRTATLQNIKTFVISVLRQTLKTENLVIFSLVRIVRKNLLWCRKSVFPCGWRVNSQKKMTPESFSCFRYFISRLFRM